MHAMIQWKVKPDQVETELGIMLLNPVIVIASTTSTCAITQAHKAFWFARSDYRQQLIMKT